MFYWFVCFEGVIWKGDKLIEGVPETLDMLRAKVGKQSLVQFILCVKWLCIKFFLDVSFITHQLLLLVFLIFQGKRLVFVTNNSTKSRKQYGKKFETLGLNVNEVSDLFHNLATLGALKSVFDYCIIFFSGGDICFIFCCSCVLAVY